MAKEERTATQLHAMVQPILQRHGITDPFQIEPHATEGWAVVFLVTNDQRQGEIDEAIHKQPFAEEIADLRARYALKLMQMM